MKRLLIICLSLVGTIWISYMLSYINPLPLILIYLLGFIFFMTAIICFFNATIKEEVDKSIIFGNGLFVICLFLIAITIPLFSKYRIYRKDSIIVHLEKFHKQHGKYPKNLINLESGLNISIYDYSTTENGKTFSLSYNLDGWNTKTYELRTKSWIVTD